MEEPLGKRINMERTEEAISTGASAMGVACPYCLIMLDDGAKQSGRDLKVLDVAQVVAASVGVRDGVAPAAPAVDAGGDEPDGDDSTA
jgi:Fe-S oxidoreductase